MKIRCKRSLAILVLLGLWIPSNATEPGYLHAEGRIWYESGKFVAVYDLDFRLPESSGGVLPTAEAIEIELQGDLNPDGSEGSAFVISIPMTSLIAGLLGEGWHLAYNPPGLRISQVHHSFVWDFPVGAMQNEVRGENNLFVLFRPPEAHKVGQIYVRLAIYDDRVELDESTPMLPNLLAGNPILRIGQYEWKSQIQAVRFSSGRHSRYWFAFR